MIASLSTRCMRCSTMRQSMSLSLLAYNNVSKYYNNTNTMGINLLSLKMKMINNNTIIRSIGFAPISPKSLSQIVDLDKLMKEDRATVETIWTSYHQDNTTTSASASAMVLNKEEGDIVKSRAKIAPLFIIPVFKSSSLDSYVMLVSQYQNNGGFILTYLEEYRRSPDTASPWMSIMLYSDLEDSKDITLLRSDFTANVTKKENVAISKMIMEAYLADDLYDGYVHTFNKEPSKFDFDKFLSLWRTKYSSKFT